MVLPSHQPHVKLHLGVERGVAYCMNRTAHIYVYCIPRIKIIPGINIRHGVQESAGMKK